VIFEWTGVAEIVRISVFRSNTELGLFERFGPALEYGVGALVDKDGSTALAFSGEEAMAASRVALIGYVCVVLGVEGCNRDAGRSICRLILLVCEFRRRIELS